MASIFADGSERNIKSVASFVSAYQDGTNAVVNRVQNDLYNVRTSTARVCLRSKCKKIVLVAYTTMTIDCTIDFMTID